MKIYTTEQVNLAMQLATFTDDTYNQVLEKLTPIELPSDEKIDKIAEKTLGVSMNGFRLGAKWMKEQILNQTYNKPIL